MDPFAAYLLVVVGALVICGLGTYLSPAYKRPCPRCTTPIAVAAKRCRTCSYELR